MTVDIIKCPKCQVPMREREQGNVIIDICPQCRGVWLDSGELEKLSVRESRYYERDDDDDDDWGGGRRERHDDDDDDDRPRGYDRPREYGDRPYDSSRVQNYPQRKKKGFLSSMMENFGGGEGGDD